MFELQLFFTGIVIGFGLGLWYRTRTSRSAWCDSCSEEFLQSEHKEVVCPMCAAA